MRLVTHESGRHRRMLHWRDRDGVAGRTALSEATVGERMTLFTEGPARPELLWLRLSESGLPPRPSSWEGVFRVANDRCEAVLSDVMDEPPFCTPHMCGTASRCACWCSSTTSWTGGWA
ncbi:hypothetical protein [Streptomyces smyrnaeus]|uniref:hypothetical protein n=1 Tax=Streptomyces smyrnaeus TaxID=1387713 RepID=UPI0033D70F35